MASTVDFNKRLQELQQQTLETVAQGQSAVVEAVRAWAEGVDKFVSPLSKSQAQEVPDPEELINGWFGFARQLLNSQEEFAKGLVRAASKGATTQPKAAEASTKGASKA